MSTETKTRVAWRWCCQQPHFTSQQLQDAAEMSRRYCDQVIAKWLFKGFIKHIPGTSHPASYELVELARTPALGKGSNQPPRCLSWRKTKRQKMWNSMMINRSFGLSDLMLTCDVSYAGACSYTERLSRAGYIKVLRRFQPRDSIDERTPSRYQLVRNTGRRSPIIRPNGCWDQNEQRLYPFLTEENEHGYVA